MANRDSKGRFLKGHKLCITYPKGYNKNSWFKNGHKGELRNQFAVGNKPNTTSFKKGEPSWNKGKNMNHSGSFKCAEKHPNWLGGIGKLPYSYKFNNELKKQIRKRDNYTCQECNYTEEQLKYKLSVHHIDYNKKNNEDYNLISLCKSCHAQTNFKREDWANYFQERQILNGN